MPTLTLPEQRTAVEQNRHEREVAFEAHEQRRRRLDEVTDQAERLAAPMQNTFEYELTRGGLRSEFGEVLLEVFEEGHRVAEHQAQHDPRWVFERNRRKIEVAEQREIEAFAVAQDSGVRITSLSLDQSDYDGMRAVAASLGYQLPEQRPSSEDILSTRMWIGEPPALVVQSPIPDAVRVDGVKIGGYDRDRARMLVRIVTPLTVDKSRHQAVADNIRITYDQSLVERLGGEWFAGRRPRSVSDAKTFIEHPNQADLLEAHMGIVDRVHAQTSDKAERNRLLEPHRYNFAAALADRMDGKAVTSLAGAGDAARAEGKSFDGDCPTGDQAPTSTSQQMEKLGYSTNKSEMILKCVNCPFCRRVVDAKKVNTRKEQSIECLSCHKKVDLKTGKIITDKPRPEADLGKKVLAITKVVPQPRSTVRQETLTIGGTKVEYIDLRTGLAVTSYT